MVDENNPDIRPTCKERSRKYAVKIGQFIGLSDEETEKLALAYEESCERWKSGYKKGIMAYAKITSEVQKPLVPEPKPETPGPTATEEPAATSEQD